MGRVHPRVGSGPIVRVCVGHPGLYKMFAKCNCKVYFCNLVKCYIVLLKLFSVKIKYAYFLNSQ